MEFYDQEINMLKSECMHQLMNYVGTLWAELSCLNRCLVLYEGLFSTQITRPGCKNMAKDPPEMNTQLDWQIEVKQDTM